MKVIKFGWNMRGADGFESSCDCPTKHELLIYPTINGDITTKVIKYTRAIWLFGAKIK